MLHAEPRKSRKIVKAERHNDALHLESDYGLMCIAPKTEGVIRVCFSPPEKDLGKTSLGVTYDQNLAEWKHEETDKAYKLHTDKVTVKVMKATGTVKFFDREKNLLLAERGFESKVLDGFDAYRVDTGGRTKEEIIKTPDGDKKVIRQADRVFDKRLYRATLHVSWQEGEALYGLGQAEEGTLNLRGTKQYLHQANMKIAVPFLVSSKGYGLLFATDSPSIFNDTEYGSYMYAEACEKLDYYFVAGPTFDEIISGYRLLTGKATMLPKWAFGYLQSQERYETQEEVVNIAREYKKRNIKLSCIIQDWMTWPMNPVSLWGQKTFDETRYPDPEKMMEELHEMEVKLLISIWPHMDHRSDNYREFKERDLLLAMWNVYDAFNPEARKLYFEQANRGLFSKGIDGWWCDNNEPITPEWTRREKPEPSALYFDYVRDSSNHMPVEKCNTFGLVHAQGIYEGQREVCDKKRVVNLTRSGYAGSQRYGTILWSGDISASWETLKKQIVAGLNFTASGLPYWTLDIGAFFVKQGRNWFWNGSYQNGTEDLGYKELYTRWFWYGAFLPIFRAHGTDIRREVWAFGEPGDMFYDSLVAAIELRYKLMPYIYSYAGQCWHSDYTIMRMLAFDFPHDEIAVGIKDQYMFGSQIMVCPVTEPMYYNEGSSPIEGAKYTKTVYLPKGSQWYDFKTNKVHEGGTYVEANADITGIPLFVKAGSIIPMDEGEPTLYVYPGLDGKFMYYSDAGDGYGYENGEYSLTKIKWSEKDREVTFKALHGEVVDKFKVVIVGA